jgi:hypothetical protein
MNIDDLTREILALRGEQKQLFGKVEEIRVQCAGRCGMVREIGRLAGAAIAGALAALGIKYGQGTGP